MWAPCPRTHLQQSLAQEKAPHMCSGHKNWPSLTRPTPGPPAKTVSSIQVYSQSNYTSPQAPAPLASLLFLKHTFHCKVFELWPLYLKPFLSQIFTCLPSLLLFQSLNNRDPLSTASQMPLPHAGLHKPTSPSSSVTLHQPPKQLPVGWLSRSPIRRPTSRGLEPRLIHHCVPNSWNRSQLKAKVLSQCSLNLSAVLFWKIIFCSYETFIHSFNTLTQEFACPWFSSSANTLPKSSLWIQTQLYGQLSQHWITWRNRKQPKCSNDRELKQENWHNHVTMQPIKQGALLAKASPANVEMRTAWL